MIRLRPIALLLIFATACGLTDDERDETDKYAYVTFSDAAFERFCLERYDTDNDGRVSRYEAHAVATMDCAGLDIRSLNGIEAFVNLRALDCSDNLLDRLDVTRCIRLERLDCGGNVLASLDVRGLRQLASLLCMGNDLRILDLTDNVSLSRFNGSDNDFRLLNLSTCATRIELLRTTGNPSLTVIYLRADQQVSEQAIDGWTRISIL